MKIHPVAEVFPLLEGEAFDALVNDIKENGLVHPIVTFEKKILDGRNRFRACEEVGIKAKFEEYKGGDPVGYVISTNITRRHLDESQRAMVFAELAKLEPGRREIGKFSDLSTQAEVAALLNISDRSGRFAKQVLKDGAPELISAVKQGKIAVSAAAKLIELSKEKQAEAVGRVERNEISGSHLSTEVKREQTKAKLEDVAAIKAKTVIGVYDVIVIDPPWPMEKIERDVRPNQVEFDYPTMSEDELRTLVIPCADDCHVWLWTTHKFLPMAFRLLDAWLLKYVCAFVWHKPGGFQPIELPQYNCEFALYARRGAPKFIDTKAFPVCFEAPRGKHSEKPEEFYNVLRRVTAGRRLDMFNRRKIGGFDVWGKEAAQNNTVSRQTESCLLVE